MFYLYLLLALAALVVAIFSAPLRTKVWVALSAVGITTVAIAIPAIGVLMGASPITIIEFASPLFGAESLSIDPLSAMMLPFIRV